MRHNSVKGLTFVTAEAFDVGVSASRTPVRPPVSRFVMPRPAEAPPGTDLIAIGADLEPGTLLRAYTSGLFPMPVDPTKRRSRMAWYSPDPRGILPLDGLRVSSSLRRSLRRFEVRFDTAFCDVVTACADPERAGHWITGEILDAYSSLHDLGWAHSVEVFDDHGYLVGGLYGVRCKGLFAGESMFHRTTDASKVALVHLVAWLNDTGASLLDVQWTTPHLESLGAIAISRDEYLDRLADAIS